MTFMSLCFAQLAAQFKGDTIRDQRILSQPKSCLNQIVFNGREELGSMTAVKLSCEPFIHILIHVLRL